MDKTISQLLTRVPQEIDSFAGFGITLSFKLGKMILKFNPHFFAVKLQAKYPFSNVCFRVLLKPAPCFYATYNLNPSLLKINLG